LGLDWDGPVRAQSEHLDDYAAVLDSLRASGLIYPCFCSRADIQRQDKPFGLDSLLQCLDDDTGLDTTNLNQLSVMMTWGRTDCSDLFATPNGATISGVSLDVEGHYLANPLRDGSGMAVSGTGGKPFLVACSISAIS